VSPFENLPRSSFPLKVSKMTPAEPHKLMKLMKLTQCATSLIAAVPRAMISKKNFQQRLRLPLLPLKMRPHLSVMHLSSCSTVACISQRAPCLDGTPAARVHLVDDTHCPFLCLCSQASSIVMHDRYCPRCNLPLHRAFAARPPVTALCILGIMHRRT
jgi:hypothetical protein